MTQHDDQLILLTGGTGTTGRRIADRLRSRNVAVRCASRVGSPPFDWNRPETWAATVDSVTSAYIAYSPDLAVPGAVDTVRRFCAAARQAGVEQFVLLAGRGESENEAAEQVVRDSGARWTIVRASWFDPSFSYVDVTAADFIAGAVADGVPASVAHALAVVFESVLDGRNAHLGHGTQQALGRAARDFSAFVSRSASEGAWSAMARGGAR